jgi:RNA polymerase sigma-70 factor (family 1)
MEELLHRIQYNDDELAFDELYKNNVVKLYRFAYSFLNDKESCEEIVNDVFIKLWTTRRQLGQIRNINVYLYVAVKNASLNHLRSVSSKRLREINFAEFFYFQLSTDPAQLLIGKELQQDILNAIHKLPPRCKLIFKMVKEDGLSCKEVAMILDLSDKTVFAQLAIVLKKLESRII